LTHSRRRELPAAWPNREIAARRGRPADTTVAEFASRWLQMHPREKESTNIGYTQQIKPFVERFGEVALREVTVEPGGALRPAMVGRGSA
jgi:hypothetical protein